MVEKAGDVVVDIINSRPIEEILNMSFPREVSSHIQEEIQA